MDSGVGSWIDSMTLYSCGILKERKARSEFSFRNDDFEMPAGHQMEKFSKQQVIRTWRGLKKQS